MTKAIPSCVEEKYFRHTHFTSQRSKKCDQILQGKGYCRSAFSETETESIMKESTEGKQPLLHVTSSDVNMCAKYCCDAKAYER